MGDFFLDGVRDRIHEYFLEKTKAEDKKIDPVEFECRRLEAKLHESYYLQRPHLFFQEPQLEKCRARREAAPVEPIFQSKPDPIILKALEKFRGFAESLATSAEHYAKIGMDYWENPQDLAGQVFKILVLCALSGLGKEEAASPSDIDKGEDGNIHGSFEFRGQRYRVETREDLIIVNGRVWKFEGTTTKTEAAEIRVEKLEFDPDEESLKLTIKGSVLFFEEQVSKSFQGDQVAKLLEALTNTSDAVATPEMAAKGIRLVPKEAA